MNFIKAVINRYIGYYNNSIVLQRFAKVFSLDVLVRASNMLLLPVYLKLMTVDEVGLFNYLLSIIGIFSIILNFGLYLSQTKLYHDYNEEEKKSLVFTVVVMLLAFLSITIIPIYIFRLDEYVIPIIFSHPINYSSYRNGLFIAIVVTILSFMLYNFLMTSEKVRKFQWYNFVKLFLVNSVVIYLLYTKKGDGVMTRLNYSYTIELFIFACFSYLYIKNMKPKFNFKYAKKALVIGTPTMLSALVGVVYNFSDKFILEKYGNMADLGIYSIGVQYATILMVIFTSFQTVFLPLFFKEKDVAKNFNKTKIIISKMVIIFTAISVGLFFAFKVLLFLSIIPIKYQPILAILPILLITQITQAVIQLLSNYIVYFEIVYVGTVFSIFLSILNIGLNLMFIPKLNIMGAAISSLLVAVISVMLYYYFIKNKCRRMAVA
jgi:Membrane protein involved in the export of O-antigen and teichoic acid